MPSRRWHARAGLLLGGLILAILFAGYVHHNVVDNTEINRPITASSSAPSVSDAFTVADLPQEAQGTLALIDRGGPYPYRQDNGVFGNRERLLPARPAGYYREFTVVTPGSDDRGARRLIRGQKGEIYYTSDHYASFHLVERN